MKQYDKIDLAFTEKAINKVKKIIALLTLLLVIEVIRSGMAPGNNFVLGDPYFVNDYPASLRAPVINNIVLGILLLVIVLFAVKYIVKKITNNINIR